MSNQYQQKLLLAYPLLFYVIFFRSFPCLLGKIVTKYAINDFGGTILLCAYYTLVSLLLVGYLLKQNGRAFFQSEVSQPLCWSCCITSSSKFCPFSCASLLSPHIFKPRIIK